VELGLATSDHDLVRSGLPELERLHGLGVRITLGWPWLVSRLVGDAHAALGDVAAAERWYRTADTEASRGGLAVERAQVTLGRARLALAQGRGDEARALAATSAAELDHVDALLLARAARQAVEHPGHDVPTPRDRIILFTDMVGSTELNVRAGDDEYVALLEEHDRILRSRFRRHDGVVYTHTGDGMSAWFTSVGAALSCAFGVHSDLERASMLHPELPLRVRIGISAGHPVDTGEGLFGLAVVEAARICALADAGQVFVSDAVRAQADDNGAFSSLGPRELKGFPEQHTIHEALAVGRK
jgi:class 3 adenylate cyclase